MDNVIDNGIRVNLRMRFTCTVYRAVAPEEGKWSRRAVKKGDTGEIMMKNLEQGGWEALESGGPPHEKHGYAKDKEIMCFTTRPVESFEVLNDLVVDRGPSPYVSLLELFGDEHHLTTVQADGLTISTPTGSTAYSLSAGGSLVHPEIPAILITPICPHTLSFRPMLLPDSMELRICVPFNSRSTAWASFDGRGRVELKRKCQSVSYAIPSDGFLSAEGDHIKVTASKYPFPTVCADTQSIDWFNSITRTLKWNERERQKSFVVVEEGPSRRHHKQRKFSENGEVPHRSQPAAAAKPQHLEPAPEPSPEGPPSDEEDEASDDEDDEKFDIDDLSSSEQSSNGTAEAVAESTKASMHEEALGREKVAEEMGRTRQEQAQAENAARLLSQGNPFLQKSRSRSRTRTGLQSGLETPDRFAGPHPHPPKISPRHVQFMSPQSSSSSLSSVVDRSIRQEALSPRASPSRSRTPRTRETEAESVKTPTPSEGAWRRRVSRSRSRERPHAHPHAHDGPAHSRRAFAVWGQDESDSATSDSDV
ncbi:ATP-NAD kinase-like domain-containing protein [Amylocystis lapponica]|nr:ATP-NAD kinase-like domain-containing protein [Amylocystis lapponica]